MPRTDTANRVIAAAPGAVFAAMVDRDALIAWLAPTGMTARFEHFDLRAGGSYRLVLTYADANAHGGKAGDGTDVVVARIVELQDGVRIVHAVDFPSDDPAFAGTMTMTWTVTPVAAGTLVEFRASDVPDGIDAADHTSGMHASLRNLERYLTGSG